MPDSRSTEKDFLSQLTAVVETNLSNEQFGVSELADAMNMSRSNLLRKVKKETHLSVSQLISQVRLKRAMAMLRMTSFNVSEVAYQVGFASTSYFIKCFREHYGYPPGEVGKREEAEMEAEPLSMAEPITGPITESIIVAANPKPKRSLGIWAAVGLLIALAIGAGMYYLGFASQSTPLEKSIAVLPFKNDSNDSTNVYLINGLMEATLNNLQKIKALKVISRTSAEKYRNTSKSIPEMAKELNVNYFVEGSGQKIGDRLVLNIQLIEASSDQHLWARQYRREAKDIFALQQEIAKDIAVEIQAIITPEEEKRIAKNPTDDLQAYDLFLKGRNLLFQGTRQRLEEAIPYFRKAVEQDPKFALAYADAAIAYYFIDLYHTEKTHALEVNNNADKALLYDPKLPESLVAKAMYYMLEKEYKQAVPYLEKALEYNPNSVLVLHFLSDLYNLYMPHPPKYLEYALKGIRLDIASYDSSTASYTTLHLSNALIQTGFVEESLKYIDKSLAYNPKNPFSGYLKAYILYAKTRDLPKTRQLLIRELNKDTTRIDVLAQVGQICYQMRDYESAYRYYKQFVDIRKKQQLDIFRGEDLKIGVVFARMGFSKQGEELVESFRHFAEQDQTIYKHQNLAMYYAHRGDARKAIEEMQLFSKENNYQYWTLLLESDPVFASIKDLPEFRKVFQTIKTKFWKTHETIKVTLEEKGLL